MVVYTCSVKYLGGPEVQNQSNPISKTKGLCSGDPFSLLDWIEEEVLVSWQADMPWQAGSFLRRNGGGRVEGVREQGGTGRRGRKGKFVQM